MLPPESEPVPLQAQRLAVPLLEACPVRRLPLLCMCLSFGSSILFEHSVFLRQKIVSRSCRRFDLGPRRASLFLFLVTLKSSLHQQPQNLNRILPLRFDCKDCLNASLNWSSGYTCSTAAESDPSATRSPSFW